MRTASPRSASPERAMVLRRGIPYVIDLAACRRMVAARRVDGGSDPIETLAETVGVGPESVGRFLRGDMPSLATTMRVLAELVDPRDDGDTPHRVGVRHGPDPPRGGQGASAYATGVRTGGECPY